MLEQPDRQRLQRRLELLEIQMSETGSSDERKRLRDEMLVVHRQFDTLASHSNGPDSPTADHEEGAEGEALHNHSPDEGGQGSVRAARSGYYDDPFTDEGYERHFDGHRWGHSTHPSGGPTLDDLDVPEDERITDGTTSADLVEPLSMQPSKPGFYPDPFTDEGYERHFDGECWGDGTHPSGGPTLGSLSVSDSARADAASPGHHPAASRPPSNRLAVTGFVLGLASILLYPIGMVPILAVVFSAIGLGTYRPGLQSGRWMGVIGLLTGSVYTLAYLVLYGHIAI